MLKLYVIPLSHPAFAARLMLQHKGLEHEVVKFTAGFHPLLLRLAGFSGGTVPALKIDDRKVQGTLQISRALEELEPRNPLFPADPEKRALVEEAERWGEAELQPLPRRLFRWCLVNNSGLRRSLAKLNGMPAPGLMAVTMKPLASYFAHLAGANDQTVQADLKRLPAMLDHVDSLIARGIIGGPERNAADFQIGTCMRILLTFEDLRGLVEGRPGAELAMKLLPSFPGHVPPMFPPQWLTAGR